jgi:hypothetical protein
MLKSSILFLEAEVNGSNLKFEATTSITQFS